MKWKMREYMPAEDVLVGWRRDKSPPTLARVVGKENCRSYVSEDAIFVVVSLEDFEDSVGVWLHVSVSRMGRLPSWSDLKRAKKMFLGDRVAIQLFPPEASWINIADCLHLFTRLDADTVDSRMWEK